MVWLAVIAGGGAAESAPGAATPDANAGGRAPSGLRPIRLRCEYLANPLGIDVREPRLSWAVESEQNGQAQTAYRILAASSEQRLAAGQGDLWDSGVVSSAETLHVPYAGTKLASRQRCYWRVQVWDKDGTPAGTSEVAWFEMGLLEPGDWQKAHWITGAHSDVSPRLRRAFTLRGPVASARLYLCGQGAYEASINGQPVSDQVLGPTLSYFSKRMLYDTFDVTALLRQGDNAIGVWLAPGWFGDPTIWQKMPMPVKPSAFPNPASALLAQLEVRCADGSTATVCSDERWTTAPSPLIPVRSHWTYCFGFSGETYDATRETRGWDAPGFDDTGWNRVSCAPMPTAEVHARMVEPNRIRAITKPAGQERIDGIKSRADLVAILNRCGLYNGGTTFGPEVWFFPEWQKTYAANFERCGNRFLGGWVYDLGRHVSGWVELRVTGRRGDWVCLFGLDCHRLQGVPNETVRLHFVHRAVRCVPVFFFGEGPEPEIVSVRGLDIGNDVESVGRFACSDPALTEIAAVVKRTVEAHLLSGMLMDSWQERFGTFLPTEAAVYGWDLAALCNKLTMDFRDQQRPDGWFQMYGAPISLDYPALKEPLAHLPWLAYVFYGDRQMLRANYDSIRKYTELILPRHDLTARTWRPLEQGQAEAGYGDHGRPTARWYDPHTGDLYETMQMVGYFRTVERIARVLNENADAGRYREVQTRLIDKCNRPEFLDREAGLYGGGDQGCHAQALTLDIVPPELREKVAERLIRDIVETRRGHLNTGFGGTIFLLKALIELNRSDVAHSILANETPPSIWSMLRHPQTPQRLTILPEFYTGGMIPHPGLSTIGFWFYQGLGGICPDLEQPGFRRFIIRPRIDPALTWVEAEYRSVRGLIVSRWKREGNRLIIDVTVPPNTQALVHVPGKNAQMKPAAGAAPSTQTAAGDTLFTVPGGKYTFESRL
jgi:alpha-L-rhamnosidase